MKVVEVKNVQSKPNPHGVDARNLSDTESAQVMHITMQPGESLKKHVTAVDVVFYVLEGRATVEIGEERTEVGADTLIESPARDPSSSDKRWNGAGACSRSKSATAKGCHEAVMNERHDIKKSYEDNRCQRS